MKISFVVEPFFQKNRIFSTTDLIANRDDCQVPFARLKEALAARRVQLETFDLLPVKLADAVLFLNAPKFNDSTWKEAKHLGIPIHVLAMESEYIHTPNADRDLLDRCDTVFTYRDDWLDGRRYFPLRYSQKIRLPVIRSWRDRKFSCMFASNKWSVHPDELYSARLRVIKWYLRHAPERFDLYGSGWNLPIPSSLSSRIFRKVPGIRDFLAPSISNWRGQAQSKIPVISDYRFCYCFENFSGPLGWITEKIFDVLFAGAIPVYWGPININNHIMKECFIDASKFKDVHSLDSYLASLSDDDCVQIQSAGARYLGSAAALDFSIETFIATLVERISIVSRTGEIK
jgi:alpha(1,3/1,4) fucosyltransferase